MPIYLKYQPVKGLSTAWGHAQWIELTSCSMDGKNEMRCTKVMDGNSAELINSDRFDPSDCMIDFVKTAGSPYMRLKLSNVMISSYSSGGSRTDGPVIDSFTLNYTKMEFQTYSIADEILSEVLGFILPSNAPALLAPKTGHP